MEKDANLRRAYCCQSFLIKKKKKKLKEKKKGVPEIPQAPLRKTPRFEQPALWKQRVPPPAHRTPWAQAPGLALLGTARHRDSSSTALRANASHPQTSLLLLKGIHLQVPMPLSGAAPQLCCYSCQAPTCRAGQKQRFEERVLQRQRCLERVSSPTAQASPCTGPREF